MNDQVTPVKDATTIGHEMLIHARRIGDELKAVNNGLRGYLESSIRLLKSSEHLPNSYLRERLKLECIEAEHLLRGLKTQSLDHAVSTLAALQNALSLYGEELCPDDKTNSARWKERRKVEAPDYI